ncbi:MAG TPA: hybrid sensor histidine kinase/response regulator [Gammaproteobacteria bacterium]|nr:hybrid sensor histidine kinase/response regulator [Gammaproteobacteria bacterium]
MDEKLKILVVDDDEVDRMIVLRALKSGEPNAQVDEVDSAAAAATALRDGGYACALLDHSLPDGDGLSVLNNIRNLGISTPVVMLTGQSNEKLIVDLMRAGASDYLSKNSLNSETLLHCVHTAIRLHQANEEKRQAERALKKSHAQLQEAHHNLQESHEQLLQSEKLASIGQLAAGVAHEINNPVGYVYSNLGTLQEYTDGLCRMLESYEKLESLVANDEPELQRLRELKTELDVEYLKGDVRNLVSESREGIARVKGIVQDLKDFSHVDEAEWQWADLHRGLDSTLNIVNNEIKYKAKVIREYGELPSIECLASQLNQVFMNLLVNAAHAIKEQGTITIRTGMEGKDKVWVEISDTGSGISSENMKKIFDPFFTTKGVGKGTGLGLSLSYGIVNKHGGLIEAESEIGRGSTFRISLPVSQSNKEQGKD